MSAHPANGYVTTHAAHPPARLGHHIGGCHVVQDGGRTGPVHDPATGMIRADLCYAGKPEVDAAVAAAAAAFQAWAALPSPQRARVLFRYRELLEREQVSLAELITCEHGKTLADARGELQRGMEVVEFACGVPHLLKGDRKSTRLNSSHH